MDRVTEPEDPKAVRFLNAFDPLKPRSSWIATSVSLLDALQQIGGDGSVDALVAWDRDVSQVTVKMIQPDRTWATAYDGGGRVWVSKTALSPVPIDLGRVWEYARPTVDGARSCPCRDAARKME
jgi:hypothetical protein